MNPTHKAKQPFNLTISLFAAVLWTIVITLLYVWSINNERAQTIESSKYQARAFFEEIVTTRYWNAGHGGVYVPITSGTQPNPYLDDPDRDVVTVKGIKMTKINPAYMTRQIGKIASAKNLVWFHLTSSKPIRPENAPDSWELGVLRSFAEGSQEYSEFIDSGDGKKVFRYMAPLWVEQPCLKCHSKQGYKEGDLRGGISITIQAEPILAIQRLEIKKLSIGYAGIWLFGLLGVVLGWRLLTREELKREKVIIQLQKALRQVKTLRGMLPICASCKKIRDDKGYWNQIESYIRHHSEAEFTHSICPECSKKLYPGLNGKDSDSENS